jgi:hypothetical protein
MLTGLRKIVAWLAWSLCLACVSLVLFAVFGERDLGAVLVLVIGFSVVGALIVSHRQENLTSWSPRDGTWKGRT